MIFSRILSVFVLVGCLPLVTWTFVAKTPSYSFQQTHYGLSSSSSSSSSSSTCTASFGITGTSFRSQRCIFLPATTTRLQAAAKDATEESEDDDDDSFDSDGWEPKEEDLLGVEDEDLDELDIDDIDSDGGLKVSDENDDDDEDAIEYADNDENDTDEEEDIEDDLEEKEDEDIIEEEDGADDEDEDDDDDDDDLDVDVEASIREMDEEKPPEGWSEWWKNYGFDTREEMENSSLFPEGWMDEMLNSYEDPDDEFWDDEVAKVPLEENPDDPLYNEKMKMVEESSARRKAASLAKIESEKEINKEYDSPLEEMEAMDKLLDKIPDDGEEEFASIDASDLDGMDIQKELENANALFDEEPYPKTNKTDICGTGINDEDMEAMDGAWKGINEELTKEPWNKVAATQFDFNYSAYPKQYMYDMSETAAEIGSASYDVYPWLKYDMGFNVSNLILAAVKHNPDAPLILQHWYPQLMICERYQTARDRDFDFNWEDVNAADMEELERYYLGFGYEEIPNKNPSETGMISFEDADEEEIKMAAFEKWMLDVYNAEWDRKDFDDEAIKDEDNVFSDNFKMPQHPDQPSWDDAQEDIEGWKEEWEGEEENEEAIAYRDRMGESVDYTKKQDDDFQKNFRGHLIVACGPYEADLDVAEAITTRMEKEFGNRIYTETKIYNHALEEDNVFEVWLESYEIDLLHSKRRSFMGVEGWDGPAEVDDSQMDFMVKEIKELTSDDAKISYRWEELHV